MGDLIGLKLWELDSDVYASLREFRTREISDILYMKLTGFGFEEGEEGLLMERDWVIPST